MACCSIRWCGKNSKTSNYKTDGITFHRFPRDPFLKEKWIECTRKENWFAGAYSVVCSRHFTENSFYKLGNCRRLSNTAIPTLYLPVLSNTQFTSESVSGNTIPIPSTSSQCEPVSRATKRKEPETPSQSNSREKNLCRIELQLLSEIKEERTTRVSSLDYILMELETKCFITSEEAAVLNEIGVVNEEIIQNQHLKSSTVEIVKKIYSLELRSFALALNFYSTKAYKYVRNHFSTCLPPLRLVSKWYQTVDGRPGFTKESFDALNNKAETSKEELICTLMVDEMKITSEIEHDIPSQRSFGYVDFGGQLETDCNSECTEALVFFVVAINGSFKMPIGYFLVNKITGAQKANLTTIALELCHENKITIKALTFNGCPANMAMAKHLGCNLQTDELKTHFKHPVTGANVFVYFDPVHMLELFRNTFETYQVFQDETGNTILWDYIKLLQQLHEKEDFQLPKMLRSECSDIKTNIVRVSQIFSSRVAAALEYCERELKLADFQGVSATSRMIQLMNDLFDILNSTFNGYGYKQTLNLINQTDVFERLEECKKFLLTVTAQITTRNMIQVKIIDSPRFTGFLGLCVSIESAKGMFEDLISDANCDIKYLPMHQISQNHVELFFATLRSNGDSNDNPTPRLFEEIYKKCLIHIE